MPLCPSWRSWIRKVSRGRLDVTDEPAGCPGTVQWQFSVVNQVAEPGDEAFVQGTHARRRGLAGSAAREIRSGREPVRVLDDLCQGPGVLRRSRNHGKPGGQDRALGRQPAKSLGGYDEPREQGRRALVQPVVSLSDKSRLVCMRFHWPGPGVPGTKLAAALVEERDDLSTAGLPMSWSTTAVKQA
jgi:hypothetical protein